MCLYKFNIIDNYIDLSIDKPHLYYIKQKLETYVEREFHCYTDGSVKDLGKPSVSLVYGTTFYTPQKQFIDQFYSSGENNISVVKSELLPLLISLIVMPKQSTVHIFTDNDQNFSTFHKLQSKNFKITPRQYFKMINNGILWQIIMEIIEILSLNITLFKVQAHAEDIYNNFVDQQVARIHDEVDLHSINIRNQPLQLIRYIPREEGSLYTTFAENKIRRRKIQLMIEELPCIHQIQKSLNSLYKDRLCPICENEEEDFNHIWLCVDRSLDMLTLVSSTKTALKESILSHIDNNETHIDNLEINDLDIWDINIDNNKFTFIDLIKGFIPKNLSHFIDRFSKQKKLTSKILYQFRMKMGHHIFHEYWLKCCQEMEKKDKDLGINKNLKKRHFGVDCLYRLRQQSTINKYEDLIGIRNNIYYGSDILGYYDSCTP
ncbi:ribonuclease H-like domain-containing protein [Rhizophagus irregularis DAOM 181602=DAOM 197198]|nr:ribonuclease H-like domain-containing protein [Rhizophagus irregularis DAOM 181602=DAOM 197198]